MGFGVWGWGPASGRFGQVKRRRGGHFPLGESQSSWNGVFRPAGQSPLPLLKPALTVFFFFFFKHQQHTEISERERPFDAPEDGLRCRGLSPNCSSLNLLLGGYARAGDALGAEQALKELQRQGRVREKHAVSFWRESMGLSKSTFSMLGTHF